MVPTYDYPAVGQHRHPCTEVHGAGNSTSSAPGLSGSHRSTCPWYPSAVITHPSGCTAAAQTVVVARPSSTGLAREYRRLKPAHTGDPPGDHPPIGQRCHRQDRTAVAAQFGRAGPGGVRIPDQHPPVLPASYYPPVRQHRRRDRRFRRCREWRPISACPAWGYQLRLVDCASCTEHAVESCYDDTCRADHTRPTAPIRPG